MSEKEEMSEEFEANPVDSLINMPLATIDIKDDVGSKYFVKLTYLEVVNSKCTYIFFLTKLFHFKFSSCF
jgi:hypothetical protein